jgi:tetratricopeptide (TPR) repeat protein
MIVRPSLIEGNSNLMDYAKLQSLYEEQMEVVKKVGYLREIDSSTQAIRIAPYDPDAYYKRGMSFLALGDKQGSIGDFTEAIQLNSNHASAYYSRGLAHSDLGNKKRAVQDLREAAKLFFDAGDIASYQMAKDASKQIHELNSSVSDEDSAQLAVGSLFG